MVVSFSFCNFDIQVTNCECMKRIIMFILTVLSAGSFAFGSEVKALLKTLDRDIAGKQRYIARRQASIDSLKVSLAFSDNYDQKISLAQQLCFSYSTFVKDSAIVYAAKMDEFARHSGSSERIIEARIDYVRVLCSMGYFREAIAMLSEIVPSTLSPRLHSEYLLGQVTIHNHQEEFATNPMDREQHRNEAQKYRDSLLLSNDIAPNIRVFIVAATLLSTREYDSAIKILDSVLVNLPPSSRDGGIVAYNMACAYQSKDDEENAIKYFTLSSIADIRNGVREYISLRKLANLMFDTGDIDRAYSYMKCAMEDAILCNARINTLEASDMYILIEKAFRQRESHNRNIIALLFVVAALMAGAMFVLLLLIRKQNLRIESANNTLTSNLKEIEKINSELSDSSIIKEQYVGLYMEQYANYLSMISSLQKRALKIARSGNINNVIEYLTSGLDTEQLLKQFYDNFDVTILNLFPNFVTDFNALLAPEHTITPKQGELLTPELRIFALIRLGITDSVKISHFLQYSLSTIYNYRTKMRNKAKGNRNEFEINVSRIGRKLIEPHNYRHQNHKI